MGNSWGCKQLNIAPFTNKNRTPVAKSPKAPANGLCNGKGGEDSIGKIVEPNLKAFTYQALKSSTNGFRKDTILGEGGFGYVYKGWIDASTLAPSKSRVGVPIAVKRCKANGSQGVKEWKTEVEFLGKFSHHNLVKLIGYCSWEEKELLLVYEFMQKGSLATHLFQEPPSWSTRIKIAIDAARGLDFLNTTEEVVIYRDFKAANILLDENYNAKLSDFGIARLGPSMDVSHVTTQPIGTYGYIAPEYMNNGHLYVKSDVYSFGVVLQELITGLRTHDLNRPTGQTKLVDWCKPKLTNMSTIKQIVDIRMREYPPKAMFELAQLILRCLQIDYKIRPDMSEVLSVLENIGNLKIGRKTSNGSSLQLISDEPQPFRHTHGR